MAELRLQGLLGSGSNPPSAAQPADPPSTPADSTSNSKNRKDPMKTTCYHPPFSAATASWFSARPAGGSSSSVSSRATSQSSGSTPGGQDPVVDLTEGRYPADWSKAKRRKQRKKDVAAKVTGTSRPGKQRGSAKSRKKGPDRFLGDPGNDPKVLKRKLHQCQSKLAKQRQRKRKRSPGR
jgi:hypothetical protein